MVTKLDINFDELKIKPLSNEQIIISVDRLTRFKFTEDKYLRVFTDVILSNLISPKLKKKDLSDLDYVTIKTLAEKIFNVSIELLTKEKPKDFSINQKLKNYENSIYKLNEQINELLDNKINYKSILNILKTQTKTKNLQWLTCLDASTLHAEEFRKKSHLKFPISAIIITEGITEEILLPQFAKLYGYDFDDLGFHIISAGGKNQVVKLFYDIVNKTKLPIFVLLDKDAQSNYLQIQKKLRPSDKVHLLASGEFEDMLNKNLIKKTLNNLFLNFSQVTLDDLNQNLPMVKILEEIFKTKGFHEFKKADFAYHVKENISSKDDLSIEIIEIIKEVRNLHSA